MTDTFKSLESAVTDIMMKNQNLYQQDAQQQFAKYSQQTPEDVEAQIQNNVVDAPDPTAESEMVDPETVIPGSSGVSDGE